MGKNGPAERPRRRSGRCCSGPEERASPHVASVSERVCEQALLHRAADAEEVDRLDARHMMAVGKLSVRQDKDQD